MRRAVTGIFLLTTAVLSATAQKLDPRWQITFDEEFEGEAPDLTKWAPHDPVGRQRDLEVQAYIPSAVSVADGIAQLRADRGRALYDGVERAFTSGFLSTYGTFAQTYGRFEIRCRMPVGRGLEPKFWLLPVPSGNLPAIDVFDALGSNPAQALFGNEWGDERTPRSYRGAASVPMLASTFHVFAIEWDEEKIVWFVDGKERFRSTDGIPHQPMYLALSLSIGGERAGYPDSTTYFPAVFDVDHVRVYQSHGSRH